MAIFNRTYSPLRTQLSMLVAEGSLTQDYDADNKVYTPDRRIRPTAIQPICSITDPAGILDNGVVNSYITDIKWYENEISEANLISPNDARYKIDSTSNTDNRGRIIVMKNVHFDAPVTLIFTATFADMVNGKIRRKAYFVGRSVLASNVAASSPLVLKTDYPRGRCFNPIVGLDHLKLSADLVAGNEPIPSAYWWYKKNGVNETLITDYVGHNTGELEVPTAQIGKEQHYVCKVQDCRPNLTEVRNEYLQAELDKMAGYPRNLLAKQYFLDLNDEIRPGVVTEGEDADGKYICIPRPGDLYEHVDRSESSDLFSGKISFKENTRYILRVSGKYIFPELQNIGLYLIFVYTDGSKRNLPIGGSNEKEERVFVSESGKSLSHISTTFSHGTPLYIYDIQLTEVYDYNLLVGNTEEVSVVKDDIGGNSDKFKAVSKIISKTLAVGSVLTLKVDGFENVAGNPTSYSFGIYQGDFVSQISGLKIANPIANFTINNKYDATKPAILIMYAGLAGATTGNKVRFKNVQLIEGKFAWNVLGKDIPEVTAGNGGDDIYARKAIPINIPLLAGGKYTLNVDDISFTKGNISGCTVFLNNVDGINSITVTDLALISNDNKVVTFTVKSNYNSSLPANLLLYAGTSGQTSGNIVQFKNVRLLQGEAVLPSMPSYTPHFIPAAPDVEVKSEKIGLPEGYRPDVQGKTIDHEFTLVTRLPPYKFSVVTPYGDDSGVISIPSDVKLFPAWIKADVSGIGTLDNPEKYFSADWGNGLKGMKVLLDADDIGLGVQEVAPDVVEGMEHVRYGAKGAFSINTTFFDAFSDGTRILFESHPSTITELRGFCIRKDGLGIVDNVANDKHHVYVVFGNTMYKAAQGGSEIVFPDSVPHMFEVIIGDSLETCRIIVDGIEYDIGSNGIAITGDSVAYSQADRVISLVEMYQGGNLLHKWDFKGSTREERLSDKANVAKKVSIVANSSLKFIPL